MRPILCGIETEYGLFVEGRGAENQIEDARALVRSYPGERRVLWDYRFESPRADLRGFSVEQLAIDPADARFDEGKSWGSDADVRSDIILPNGARFYNDHGHPEYATPECRSIRALVEHDLAGIEAVRRALPMGAKAYRNNTDFHGASYGTHENYLVPRLLGFEKIAPALIPLLVARTLLCGAGKVGSESGEWCNFQLSQRADFFTEVAGVDTLFRRPIFNTRDEPHADAAQWIRLHVISGDANMIPGATAGKVGLVQMALSLAEIERAPVWNLADPVRAMREVSRDPDASIRLEGRRHTCAAEILQSYADAALGYLDNEELMLLAKGCLFLLKGSELSHHVDWAAKKAMLEQIQGETGLGWRDLQAYDLEYHNIDPDEGLYYALAEMGVVESHAIKSELLDGPFGAHDASAQGAPEEPTRARARALALRYPETTHASWGSVTVAGRTYPLNPVRDYSELHGDMPLGEFLIALAG